MAGKTIFRNIFKDPEFWAIVIFNLFLIWTYYTDEASARTVIIIYYLQSVLIGVQYFIRMVVMGFRMKKEKGVSRFGVPVFFAIHYGGFHMGYLIFLFVILMDLPGGWDIKLISGVTIFMVINTFISLFSDVKRDAERGSASGSLMFQPYVRIVPMHLLIMMGFQSNTGSISKAFLIFIGLKTLADLIMHVIVNRTYKERRPHATEVWI